jgi:hypothetical protein
MLAAGKIRYLTMPGEALYRGKALIHYDSLPPFYTHGFLVKFLTMIDKKLIRKINISCVTYRQVRTN